MLGRQFNGKLGLNSTIQTAADIEPLRFSESSALMGARLVLSPEPH